MRYILPIAFLASTGLVGCNSGTPSPTVSNTNDSSGVTDSVALVEEMAELSTDAADNQAEMAKPEAPVVDYGEWLAPPEGLSDRLLAAYPTIVSSAIAGDSEGQATLAMISQQIARELVQSKKLEAGYSFYAQAGKALRSAMKNGFDQLPASMIGPIFYDEACALSKAGKTEAAADALAEAVQNGYSDIEHLLSDDDLAEVRAMEGFDAKLAEWKLMAEEKAKAIAREELNAGETFPFTFAATDIDGNEQSLESLKGKVVIVDIWGTWCPPCRAEVPSFIKLQEKFAEQGFQMVGLNYERKKTDEENIAAVKDFIAETGINYPCIMGDQETLGMVPDFQGYPTTLFIDRTGKVRMKAVGLHDYEFLDAVVSLLLEE